MQMSIYTLLCIIKILYHFTKKLIALLFFNAHEHSFYKKTKRRNGPFFWEHISGPFPRHIKDYIKFLRKH